MSEVNIKADFQKIANTFVLKYYTMLNHRPDMLRGLFKEDSRFSHGQESAAGNNDVAIGPDAIHDAVMKLNFSNCKVTLSLVDSQESLDNGITILVIGHMSNNGQPARRFTQTFFLAAQHPAGYYVLNDMFRYLKTEPNVPRAAPAASTPAVMSAPVSNINVRAVKQQTPPPVAAQPAAAAKPANNVKPTKKADAKPTSNGNVADASKAVAEKPAAEKSSGGGSWANVAKRDGQNAAPKQAQAQKPVAAAKAVSAANNTPNNNNTTNNSNNNNNNNNNNNDQLPSVTPPPLATAAGSASNTSTTATSSSTSSSSTRPARPAARDERDKSLKKEKKKNTLRSSSKKRVTAGATNSTAPSPDLASSSHRRKRHNKKPRDTHADEQPPSQVHDAFAFDYAACARQPNYPAWGFHKAPSFDDSGKKLQTHFVSTDERRLDQALQRKAAHLIKAVRKQVDSSKEPVDFPSDWRTYGMYSLQELLSIARDFEAFVNECEYDELTKCRVCPPLDQDAIMERDFHQQQAKGAKSVENWQRQPQQ